MTCAVAGCLHLKLSLHPHLAEAFVCKKESEALEALDMLRLVDDTPGVECIVALQSAFTQPQAAKAL